MQLRIDYCKIEPTSRSKNTAHGFKVPYCIPETTSGFNIKEINALM